MNLTLDQKEKRVIGRPKLRCGIVWSGISDFSGEQLDENN
jgi:hypothetical protein